MNYEEVYNQAMSGNTDALNTLCDIAGSGVAEAQYVLSCVYDNPNSPFRDEDHGMYWLQKSAGYNYEPAIKKLKELSPYVKKLYGIETDDGNTSGSSDKNTETEKSNSVDILSCEGRVDRITYFVYLMVYAFIICIILYLIKLIPMEQDYGYYSWEPTSFASVVNIVVKLILSYLVLALGVKRLHDCGHSGWWVILVLITAPIGPLFLLFMKGEEKANEYGPFME